MLPCIIAIKNSQIRVTIRFKKAGQSYCLSIEIILIWDSNRSPLALSKYVATHVKASTLDKRLLAILHRN